DFHVTGVQTCALPISFMHRTDTIDYALVLEGECVMLLDDGEEVALSAGDILIQRGTWHGWANRSDKPCTLAFILIGATKPKELRSEERRVGKEERTRE